MSNCLKPREVDILTGVTALSSSGNEQINKMRNNGKRQTMYLIEASTNISRDARNAEDRLFRDFFPRPRAAVDACDLLPLGLLLVVAGATTVTCSYKVTVVTESS